MSATAQRRRLAPNVVCMFDDERPPVVQLPRRGRFPRVVITMHELRFRAYCRRAEAEEAARLKKGDVVEIFGHPYAPNNGMRVELLVHHEAGAGDGETWFVRSLTTPLFRDEGSDMCTRINPAFLRRPPAAPLCDSLTLNEI